MPETLLARLGLVFLRPLGRFILCPDLTADYPGPAPFPKAATGSSSVGTSRRAHLYPFGMERVLRHEAHNPDPRWHSHSL